MRGFFKAVTAIALMASVFTATACNSGAEKDISVIVRESGSGTRGAFEELLGLEAKDVQSDAEFNSTNGVLNEIVNKVNAIGYVSLGSMADTVKALKINGTEATAANIKNGTYILQRPFITVTKDGREQSALTQNFLLFLGSSQAQDVITENGYVTVIENAPAYIATPGLTGQVKIEGSTSVGPLMEKLVAKYLTVNAYLSATNFPITQDGSGAGITAARNGTCDIGMSSRELKDSEKDGGGIKATGSQLCRDGIAVIVNKACKVDGITKENLVKVYKKEIKKFSEIA